MGVWNRIKGVFKKKQQEEVKEISAEERAENVEQRLEGAEEQAEQKKIKLWGKIAPTIREEDAYLRQMSSLYNGKYLLIKPLGRLMQAWRGVKNKKTQLLGGMKLRTKRMKMRIKSFFAKTVVGGMVPQFEQLLTLWRKEQEQAILALEQDIKIQISWNRAELARWEGMEKRLESQLEQVQKYAGFLRHQEGVVKGEINAIIAEIREETTEFKRVQGQAKAEAESAKNEREGMFKQTG